MKTASIWVTAISLLVWSGGASGAAFSLNLPADYEGAHSNYAIDVGARPDGAGSLTLGHRYDYALDPVFGTLWTHDAAAVTPLMQPIQNVMVAGPAVVSLNHRIYVIGGNQNGVGPIAHVWYVNVNAAGNMGPWIQASYDYAQSAGATKGIAVTRHRAVAVGNRIYVAGGSLTIETSPGVFVTQQTVTDVYSTLVTQTGDISPWVKEPSLIKSAADFGMIFAAGAIYAIGGKYCANGGCTTTYPHQWVQKAEIMPNGRLSEWEAVERAPQGVPPPNNGCECASANPPCSPTDLACCRQKNLDMGWLYIGAFSFGRTMGFMGGRFNESINPICSYFGHLYYAYLDDCNQIVAWNGLTDDIKKGRANTSPQAYNGTFISAGGYANGFSVPDVIFNSGGGNPGITRDYSFGHDATEIRPNYAGLDAKGAGSTYEMPVSSVNPAPAVMVDNRIFVLGIQEADAPSNNVWRTTLAPTPNHVDSGHYLSRPFDMGGNMRLTNVTWSFEKHGAGTKANPDDWAMVRYRLAPDGGEWTCWTPRIPEAGNMPLTPGIHNYMNRHAGQPVPRSSQYWMPLNESAFRYIQFEVSLYKDGATLNVPEFFNFAIEYEPAPANYAPAKWVEVYPIPTKDYITLRFVVVPEGAEIKAKVFNVAGEQVSGDSWVIPKGGTNEKTVSTKGFANGTYIVLVEARGTHGGQGLALGSQKSGKARAKFVIRGKK